MKVGLSLLKVTLNVNLLFGVIYFYIGEISGNRYNLHLSNLTHEIVPDHYDIKLVLTFEDQAENGNATFFGECNVSIILEDKTSYIYLHAEKPYIQVTNVTAQQKKFGVIYTVRETLYDNESHILIFHFTNELSPGRYFLRMMFDGFTNKDAEHFFRKHYTYRKLIEEYDMWLILTNLRPTGARRLFPCWDEPEFKATFNITIRHYSYMMVLSNTRKLTKLSEVNNPIHGPMRNTIFRKTRLMSTSDIAIIMFDKIMIVPHLSNLWFRSEVSVAMEFAEFILHNVTEYLTSKWEMFHKFSETNRVLIAGFPYDALKYCGLSFYGEASFVHFDDHYKNKIKVARLAARAVVDDWLIDVDNPSRWSYLWLNEGMATLLAIDAIDKTAPELRMLDLFIVEEQHESLRLDSSFMEPLSTTVDTSKLNSHFPSFYYLRAPVLLWMLQNIVTDDVFHKGFEIYLSHRLTNFHDFCNAMQVAYNEEHTNTGLNITNVMDGWIKLKHVPVVKIIKSISSYYTINIENVNDLKDNVVSLSLPLSVAQLHSNFTLLRPWPDNVNFEGRLNGWLTLQQPNFTWHINSSRTDELVIGNLHQIGYYRVKYDLKNWRKLVKHLNSSSYINIPVLNRAQLIDDAFYFLTNHQIFLTIFLELTKYLSQETDYIVWYPMFKILEQISTFFPYDESTYIKEHMKAILDGLFSKIGYYAYNGNYLINTLRLEAARWTCILDSYTCKTEAGKRQYLTFFSTGLPWREWILCKGMMKQDYSWWKMLFDRYLERTNYTIMPHLACSENPDIIRNYIELITYNKSIQNSITAKGKKTHIYMFHSIIERHSKSTSVLDYILQKFENVKPRYMTTVATLIDIINHVYTHDSLDKIYDYVSKYEKIFSLVAKKITRRSVQIETHRKQFLYLT